MEERLTYDKDKLDEVCLALLYLTAFGEKHPWSPEMSYRAWKEFDRDVLERLYKKGYIADPKNNAKSVFFMEGGFEKARELFEKYFSAEGEE